MNNLYIQYSSFEPNEYDFFERISKTEIIRKFENYPWSEENEKIKTLKELAASPSLTIVNEKKDELVIYVYGDENIKYNCQLKENTGFIKRPKVLLEFNNQEILSIIESFCECDKKEYKGILLAKEKIGYSFLIDLINALGADKKKKRDTKNVNYSVTFETSNWKIISKSFWSFSFLLMPLVIFTLIRINTGKGFDLTAFLIAQSILSIPAIPGLLILSSYLKENKSMKIRFQRRSNLFKVEQKGKSIEFNKEEIRKIYLFESNAGNAPWTSFEYAQVNFENGTNLYFSNLLISQDKLMTYLSNIELEFKKKWIPKIKY